MTCLHHCFKRKFHFAGKFYHNKGQDYEKNGLSYSLKLRGVSSMKKRFMAYGLVFVMLFINILSIPAQAAEDITSKLNERQLYVYKMTKIVSDNQCSMLAQLANGNGNYFNKMQANGLLDVISGNKVWEAFFGSSSYSQSYLNTVIGDCIIEKNEDLTSEQMKDCEKVISEVSWWVDKAKKFTKSGGYVEKISDALEKADQTLKINIQVREMTTRMDMNIEALEMVSEETSNEEIAKAAKKILKYAKADEVVDIVSNEIEKEIEERKLVLGDRFFNAITGELWTFWKKGFSVVLGDTVDRNISEMHAVTFQSAIFNTYFNKLFAKGDNYLQNQYTDEELADLLSLAEFYCKAGIVGFGYNNNKKNVNACKKHMIELKTMLPPGVNETSNNDSNTQSTCPVQISDYSVPGTLSVGDKYVCYGKIQSSEAIQKVTVEIKGNTDSRTYSDSNINGNTYNILTLDNQIDINNLKPDQYVYSVKVQTASGEYVLLVENFEIQEENGDMTINQYRLPKPMKSGEVFSVQGIVKSATPLSNVKVQIVSADGVWQTGDEASGINAKEYNLSALDEKTRFDKLSAGAYRYVIVATNQSGTEVLVDQPFLVQ